MKIIITAKNLDKSRALNDFIEKKFLTLKKFVNILKRPDEGKTLAEVFIEVEKETKHHIKGQIFLVKAQIILPGRSLMVQARADDLFKAVIKSKDELKTEIEKYKFKKIDKDRRKQRKARGKLL